jgi:sulfate/thiosulfate-binding protein
MHPAFLYGRRTIMKPFLHVLLGIVALPWLAGSASAEPASLLNASYDVTRAFYTDYNKLFTADWQAKHGGGNVDIRMAHGGSSVQARAVLDGLDADVVTMNQDTDIDVLAERGHLLPADWRKHFPNNSVPYTSTILFLVRAGNPKGIKDWDDLVKPGISVVVPQPKTSGNGRYSYLAAWGYALKKNGGDEAKAKDFVTRLFKNAAVLDTGGRAATTTFALRGIGDVLLTFENEVYLIKNDPSLGGDKVQPVFPSMSIRADPPVAVVDKNVQKHGTRTLAEGYLRFLFSPAAQELAAKNFFRPTDKSVLDRHADTFKPIELFDVPSVFGSWAKAQKTHFDDGAIFDQIYQQ